ncbi:hypothetical protein [Microbacterium sp. NPDC089696]|uniref:hypothetical protein n=1 Tax=Microbacterium sp. NPDC089696 TaxID=3364199 RepID=UPI003813BC8E
MKPSVFRGSVTGRWWVETRRLSGVVLPGTSESGYATWREAYDAAGLVIASDPA